MDWLYEALGVVRISINLIKNVLSVKGKVSHYVFLMNNMLGFWTYFGCYLKSKIKKHDSFWLGLQSEMETKFNKNCRN